MADDRLDELLRVLEMYSFDDGRNRIVEALGAVLELHREAFARTLEIAGATDPGLIGRLRQDPVVEGILEGYGLIEADVAEQVEAALERLRPLLEKDRTAAKLMEVSSDSVSIHLIRPLDPEVSLETLTSEIQKSLREELPGSRRQRHLRGQHGVRRETPQLAAARPPLRARGRGAPQDRGFRRRRARLRRRGRGPCLSGSMPLRRTRARGMAPGRPRDHLRLPRASLRSRRRPLRRSARARARASSPSGSTTRP